jgi:hypothetical protein
MNLSSEFTPAVGTQELPQAEKSTYKKGVKAELVIPP